MRLATTLISVQVLTATVFICSSTCACCTCLSASCATRARTYKLKIIAVEKIINEAQVRLTHLGIVRDLFGALYSHLASETIEVSANSFHSLGHIPSGYPTSQVKTHDS